MSRRPLDPGQQITAAEARELTRSDPTAIVPLDQLNWPTDQETP